MQGNIAKLANDNNKLSSDVAELRKVITKNNDEVEKLKRDLVSQNKYVASLELGLGRVKKASKQQKSAIEDLQVNLDELEQYTRKNCLEFHVIPEDVGIPTNEIVCKVSQAVGVEMELEKNRHFTSLKQEKRNQTNNCKICKSQGQGKVLQSKNPTLRCNPLHHLPDLLGNKPGGPACLH